IAHGRLAVECIPKTSDRALRRESAPRAVQIGVMHNFRFNERLRKMDAWFAVSPGVASALRLVPAGQSVETVENFTDLIGESGRAPWSGCPKIGAIGRLHANKGFDLLLTALAQPDIRARSWTLTIAGDGPERPALQALAKTLGLAGRVTFTGWVDDRRAFYSAVDLVCIPSRQEPFGLVLLEALAHRLPVVASAASGFVDIATDGVHALLAPLNEIDGFSARIANLLDDSTEALEMGRRGQEMVERRFLYPAFRQRLDAAIIAVESRRRTGSLERLGDIASVTA
ncbi:MAG: glycosyltransferase, partial [Beijerinckiaceae bacterium]|nr:glycosyltransferase [Beijerinckiaceae bacterium]